MASMAEGYGFPINLSTSPDDLSKAKVISPLFGRPLNT